MRKIAGAVSYAPRQIAVAALPARVDLREWNLVGPIKNQEQVGACSGFAMSSVLDNVARRARRGDVISPLHIFTTYTGRGLEDLRGRPMTQENVWPYDPARACRFAKVSDQAASCGSTYGVTPGSAYGDPQLLGEQARADSMGAARIDAFEEMNENIDFNQIAALLADGESIWISLSFYRPAWQSPDVGRTGYLPYYPADAANEYHAVVLEGYRYGQWGREFLIRNSWGSDWGQDGRAWVPENMMRTHMNWGYRVRATLTNMPSDGTAVGPAVGGGSSGVCIPGVLCLPNLGGVGSGGVGPGGVSPGGVVLGGAVPGLPVPIPAIQWPATGLPRLF